MTFEYPLRASSNFESQIMSFAFALVDPRDHALTRHKRGDTIFHGHPNHRGNGPWKDWAVVDWGPNEGKVPAHIWCFVCLNNLPTGKNKIQHGGIDLKDGVYAVVESAKYDTDTAETTKSNLFMPLLLNVEGIDEDGDVTGRKKLLLGPALLSRILVVHPTPTFKSNQGQNGQMSSSLG